MPSRRTRWASGARAEHRLQARLEGADVRCEQARLESLDQLLEGGQRMQFPGTEPESGERETRLALGLVVAVATHLAVEDDRCIEARRSGSHPPRGRRRSVH
jgi:hypothetical protein